MKRIAEVGIVRLLRFGNQFKITLPYRIVKQLKWKKGDRLLVWQPKINSRRVYLEKLTYKVRR